VAGRVLFGVLMLMSMLINKDLTVPAMYSAVHLKKRVQAAVADSFNAAALGAKQKEVETLL
jgi:hypothetical protein